mmetsp:Transcript_10607/g.19968  ORF Transcript_10607/g.19968 Transcript_10607/m.19968 type:complete len:238 (-) Transcript_10607:239-952(-)
MLVPFTATGPLLWVLSSASCLSLKQGGHLLSYFNTAGIRKHGHCSQLFCILGVVVFVCSLFKHVSFLPRCPHERHVMFALLVVLLQAMLAKHLVAPVHELIDMFLPFVDHHNKKAGCVVVVHKHTKVPKRAMERERLHLQFPQVLGQQTHQRVDLTCTYNNGPAQTDVPLERPLARVTCCFRCRGRGRTRTRPRVSVVCAYPYSYSYREDVHTKAACYLGRQPCECFTTGVSVSYSY